MPPWWRLTLWWYFSWYFQKLLSWILWNRSVKEESKVPGKPLLQQRLVFRQRLSRHFHVFLSQTYSKGSTQEEPEKAVVTISSVIVALFPSTFRIFWGTLEIGPQYPGGPWTPVWEPLYYVLKRQLKKPDLFCRKWTKPYKQNVGKACIWQNIISSSGL